MSKKLDMEMKKAERDGTKVKELEAEMAVLQKDRGIYLSIYGTVKLDLMVTKIEMLAFPSKLSRNENDSNLKIAIPYEKTTPIIR